MEKLEALILFYAYSVGHDISLAHSFTKRFSGTLAELEVELKMKRKGGPGNLEHIFPQQVILLPKGTL
jgi:hypothetical protein